MAKSSFKIVDHGWNRLQNEFKGRAKQNRITVGVQSESGEKAVLVATWNEYGTVNMPARSFIRSAIDEHRAEIQTYSKELLDGFIEHGGDVNIALGRLGEFTKRLIQNKIRSNVPPANAASTIAKKGSSKTLIDTGAMLQSIAWKLENPGGHEGGAEHGAGHAAKHGAEHGGHHK